MESSMAWQESFHTPAALRVSHDDVRAELVRTTMEGGRIAAATKRLAAVCLPHFEIEEEFAFPALGLLPDLMKGMVRPEMAEVLPLISSFTAKHAALDNQHQLIRSSIDELLVAAHREKNRDVADFAYSMRTH